MNKCNKKIGNKAIQCPLFNTCQRVYFIDNEKHCPEDF